MEEEIRLGYDEMATIFAARLEREGLSPERAGILAGVLTDNTRDGVLSHGAGRFGVLVSDLRKGVIDPAGQPERIGGFGCFEQWDGHRGPGPLNGLAMMERAAVLALEHGVGLAAICNTTHWLRGATYGYWAVERGFPAICWTNTPPNMPAWEAETISLGNNPVVFAVPGGKSGRHVVLDMALSQYSYGKLHTAKLRGEQLPFPGGYGRDGALTTDPGAILDSMRILPAGMWKGAGLSVALDLLASVLSLGTSAFFMEAEGLKSQVFVVIHPGFTEEEKAGRQTALEKALDRFQEMHADEKKQPAYPGFSTLLRRQKSGREGIAVPASVWRRILDD